MRLPKSVLGVLAAGALLLGGAVPAVAEDAVPGDGPTTSVSAPADEAGVRNLMHKTQTTL